MSLPNPFFVCRDGCPRCAVEASGDPLDHPHGRADLGGDVPGSRRLAVAAVAGAAVEAAAGRS